MLVVVSKAVGIKPHMGLCDRTNERQHGSRSHVWWWGLIKTYHRLEVLYVWDQITTRKHHGIWNLNAIVTLPNYILDRQHFSNWSYWINRLKVVIHNWSVVDSFVKQFSYYTNHSPRNILRISMHFKTWFVFFFFFSVCVCVWGVRQCLKYVTSRKTYHGLLLIL